MRWKRFLAVLGARNKEFVRDRATLGWGLAFPMLMLLGMAFIFGGRSELQFKVGVLGGAATDGATPQLFTGEPVQLLPVESEEEALAALRRHGFDMVIDPAPPRRYWINESSSKGSVLETILRSRSSSPGTGPVAGWDRGTVTGRQLRYVEWLMPGMLALNAMFSCLFGVGFVIVRYRKNGVLRRLKVTPLTSFEFLAAQVVSRMILVLFTTALVYVGSDLMLDFTVVGSWLDLTVVFVVGSFCMIALGLLFASRTASEELAGGVINLATWPMMFLGGVWFSLDGSPQWIRSAAHSLPLTHLIEASRAIVNDGASLADVTPNLAYLAIASVVFLIAGSAMFRWE
ncbi:MAG TPA: ABC transporter permease [Thermoanaerobaculia bacterium]|nr:ABC transporter permease [Thermoanaerobaculia bacterium]